MRGHLRLPHRVSTPAEGAAVAIARGARKVDTTRDVDPAGAQDPARRCKNVNFVRHSLVAGEQEYLFAAYSVFGVWWLDVYELRSGTEAA